MRRPSHERALWLLKFVLPHEAALRAWLNRRRIHGLEVDDIVQETYAKLASAPSVEGILNAKNYMFRTAYTLMIDQVRRSKVVSFHTINDLDELLLTLEDASPEDHAIGRDELRQLANAIAAMPGRVQEVFVLRRVKGFSQREAAKELGLSESTVEKHMIRGINLLMNMFSHSGDFNARTSKTWESKPNKGHVRDTFERDRQRD